MKFSSEFSTAHISVLADEVLEGLEVLSKSRMIDATLGGGGHTFLCMDSNPSLEVMGFDQDPFARELAQKNLINFSDRLKIIPSNFEELYFYGKNFKPEAILFDLGISSLHVDNPERGFSFKYDAPLDMRMDPAIDITAEEVISNYSADELQKIFQDYGEEKFAYKIAHAIVEKRNHSVFTTTLQLAEFIEKIKPARKGPKKYAGGHAAALVFQALRMEVNRELQVIETALNAAMDIIEPKGRIAVISFHSIEDRLVKNIFKPRLEKRKRQKYPSVLDREKKSEENLFLNITKTPFVPTKEEIEKNPRSRSAKLRIIEKI